MFLNIPEFLWQRIFDVLQVVAAGILVAAFASHYLRRKDEVTRLQGVTLQKRLEAYEAFSRLLGRFFPHTPIPDEQYQKTQEFLERSGLPMGSKTLEYAACFSSREALDRCLHEIESFLSGHRLYLDDDVLQQAYLWKDYWEQAALAAGSIRSLPFRPQYRPSASRLDQKEQRLLVLLGVVLDQDLVNLFGSSEALITKKLRRLALRDGMWKRLRHRAADGLDRLLERLHGFFSRREGKASRAVSRWLASRLLPRPIRRSRLVRERDSIISLAAAIGLEEHFQGYYLDLGPEQAHALLLRVLQFDEKGEGPEHVD